MSRNTEALVNPLYIGNGANRSKFAVDGTHRLEGTSTAWRDMIGDLFGRRLNSTSGRVDYDWDNNAIKFQNNGSITTSADRVQANLEINHQFAVGANITFIPHIHWFQSAATAFVLTMRWRLQRNGQAMATSWNTVTATVGLNDIFTYTSGSLNQLTKFSSDITITCGISDTIQFQMTRTDALAGDMLVYFMDMHGQVDSFGSEEEIAKD